MGNYDCKKCFSRENKKNTELPLKNSQEIKKNEGKGESN